MVVSVKREAERCVWLPDDVLERMPYTDAVLKEVMRLHGIVDGVWRQALEDLEVQGRRVPKVHQKSAHLSIHNNILTRGMRTWTSDHMYT